MKWIIFYDVDNTFSDEDGSHENAPVFGVQVIVEIDNKYRWRSEVGFDYYCWHDIGNGYEWIGMDEIGYIDYIAMPGMKRVLFGRKLSSEKFGEIFREAKIVATREWGNKTVYGRTERRCE